MAWHFGRAYEINRQPEVEVPQLIEQCIYYYDEPEAEIMEQLDISGLYFA